MPTLAALLLATPVFGLSLTPPPSELALRAPMLLLSDEAAGAALDDDDDEGAEPDDEEGTEQTDEASASEDDEDAYVADVKSRNAIAELHRPFGIATWVAMTGTVTLGFIQYYNKYGFFADQGSNPCVQGTAIFGQGQCSGVPVLHLAAAGLTTGLYITTFTLAALMPDPDNLAEGKGEFASTLRAHKFLRWVHFGGMVAQIVLGVLVANPNILGLDRANDYGTLQALATVHLGAGLVTWGALTWAGALMTF